MFTQVSEKDLDGKGVVGQPNVPGLSSRKMQESVEQIVREVAIPAINRLIAELAAETAAGSIGAVAADGIEAERPELQAVLDGLAKKITEHGSNEENPHKVTAEQAGAYTKEETERAIRDKVAEIGAGDMAKAVYDRENKARPYLPADEALDRKSYGGSAEGVVKTADRLAAARRLGGAAFDGSADVTLGQMGALPAAGGTLTGLIRTQSSDSGVGIEIGEGADKSVRLIHTSDGYLLARYVGGVWNYAVLQHEPGIFRTRFFVGANLYSNGLELTASSEGYSLRPTGDGGLKLGTSDRRWGQIYSNVGSISTSDESEKNTVKPLSADRAEALVAALQPVTYKLNHGESGRTHWGLVSQQLERAMASAGITDMEFAGFIRSPQEDGSVRYGLRYEEFIAPLIAVVQKQKKDIDALFERLGRLEN